MVGFGNRTHPLKIGNTMGKAVFFLKIGAFFG